MKTAMLWICVVLLSAACAPTRIAEPTVSGTLPARLELVFASQLPDPYYVLSGPAFTYGRFRVNAEFSDFLRDRLRSAAPPGSTRSGTLKVEVLSLDTGFDEVGLRSPAGPPRQLAWLENPEASAGGLQIADDQEMDGDLNLPETTIKQATMVLRVQLSEAGKVLVDEKLQASFTERYDWYFDHPAMQNWARYDYHSVFKGLYRQAWRELYELLERGLG